MHIVTKFMLGSIVGTLLSGCAQDVPLYEGYAFNAMIENAHVVALKDPKKIPMLQSYVRDVHWKLDRPIDGHIDVHYGENKNTKMLIGTLINREPVDIIPLQPVNLHTDIGIQSDSSVQINGASSLSRVNILRKNLLPKGDYIFRLKVHGTRNWDRKEIYVQVR